ncbi:Peptidase family M1 [Chitinophaga rupis]|uniref:Peptidase family M1 n=1 Tax=Chitinophaga rupis TaxID=573321 RepID=A0A1H8GCQ1_9BACT|nr:M1 family metallopeptidase [Chitinophaga rupis]SEN41088.1 Peptidase family M1 [Chitinophaga rupis]
MRRLISCFLFCLVINKIQAQPWNDKTHLTHQDSLRGSVTPEREWWDVLYYAITIKPDFLSKTINGFNTIKYKVLTKDNKGIMQIDLQRPLKIDSVKLGNNRKVSFKNEMNVWYLNLPGHQSDIDSITIYYSGSPHQAANPPWDGGWVWTTDSLGRPWMTVACQGIGASTWYPCKDLQSDEPELGASLTMIVPDTLVAVGNGRLEFEKQIDSHTKKYKWYVVSPINNYAICPYIGKYVNIKEVYEGLKGPLNLSYWVLDYNYVKAQSHMLPQVHLMMKSFEHWFGAYPFYEDGFKMVDAPGYGMEHQSGIAYGNGYVNGNHAVDYSGTGFGMKWDFLIVHESAHEWFGNSITAKDPADKWIHESFACYADILYMKDYFSDSAGNEYVIGTRDNIKNDEPAIGLYNIGKEGGSDMYPKGRNMLHMIRYIINDDEKFRQILIGMNKEFYHQTVTTKQIENYINEKSGIDFSAIFDQYLRTTNIPEFEYKVSGNELQYRFINCVKDFSMPVKIIADEYFWIKPTESWQSLKLESQPKKLYVDRNFYITSVVL